MKNNLKIIVLSLFLALISSCSDSIRCNNSIEPKLIKKTLASGNLFTSYSEFIAFDYTASNGYAVHNIYYTIEGSLPNSVAHQKIDNRIEFYGIPTTGGTFNFKVKVTLDSKSYNGEDVGSDCSSSTQKNYKIIIN